MSFEKLLLNSKARESSCLSQKITGSANVGCAYLVEQSEHVPQHVRDRHVQELGEVVQVQLLALQLPGPVPVLLQNLLCVLRFQPGMTRGYGIDSCLGEGSYQKLVLMFILI